MKFEPSLPLEPGRIYRIDALDGLRRLGDGSVDLVVTDPPYAIASAKASTIRKGKLMTTKEAWGAWDQFHPFEYELLIDGVISESFRVLKEGGRGDLNPRRTAWKAIALRF